MMWYISHLIFAFTVIHKPWLLNTFENADVSWRKKWKLMSFATARRNKTDIIEIELLRYIFADVWCKRSDFTRYANLKRFWTETNFGSYIAISHKFFYSWHWLWVSTWVSFTITIIIEGFSARRIKKGPICSHIARTIYFETHSMQIQIQCNALWTKNNLRKKLAVLL